MLWKCSVCELLHEGEQAPEKCRKCGATQDKFYSLTKEDAKKIYAVDRTNDILMEMVSLAMKMNELAKEGIEINLNESCTDMFKQLQQDAWIMKQKSKREIAEHVANAKW